MSALYSELRVVPDKTSYRPCPWDKEGHTGLVWSQLENLDGTPFELCGRSLLKSASSELRKQYGYELRVGFEFDFSLIQYSKVDKEASEESSESSFPA